MIKAILVFNNHGKPRLTKFYQYYVSIFLVCYTLAPCRWGNAEQLLLV